MLDAIATDAARTALTSPRYAGRDVDPATFAATNCSQLLLLVARYPQLRHDLAERYAADLVDGDPLLRQLTDADPAVAESAATILGQDPGRLNRPPTPSRKKTAKPAASVDERRANRLQRNLAEMRESRDRARGHLEWAVRERDTARQELAAALTDRDEALAVIESLRAQLQTARRMASDVTHAAGVLAALAEPAAEAPEIDIDPRDRAGQPGGESTVVEEPQPETTPLTAALRLAGITRQALVQLLTALRSPIPSPPTPSVTTTRTRQMSLTPLGGGTDIGGSCMLVEVGDVRILIDAGMRPKQPIDRAGPPLIDLARAGHLNAIVITHAHHDHAGYIPALISDYPGLPLYCTPDTAALLPTMWADSVKVFERTSHSTAIYAEPASAPPYGQTQAVAAQHRIRPLEFGRTVEIAGGVTIELFPAGHILGAASVVITAGTSRLTVSGDVSDLAQATVPGLVVPQAARHCDLLVIESTYCHRNAHRAAEVEQFLATVLETVAAGGRVLVPAFALGRAQEVAMTLRSRLPDVPVLIDGMAKQIAHIYQQQTETSPHPLRIYGEQVREVAPNQRRELITAFRRGVIVTTSGMLTAGPAVQWARALLPDPNAALLLAGHQDEESPGAALLDLANATRRNFDLDGTSVEVNAKVSKFGLSAHADRRGLTSIIGDIAARQVMLVHGMPAAQREFAEHLTRLGRQVARTSRWQS
ncbi:MBL fold metallo-hydrolase [Plantactinospora veratri]